MLYGIVRFIIIQPPYDDKNNDKLCKKIIFNSIDFNPTIKRRGSINIIEISDDAKDLIQNLLNKNPKERLKITNILNHVFFNKININDIKSMKIKAPFEPDNVIKFI